MEITLGFKPSVQRLTEIAEQFGTLPQSGQHFIHGRASRFFNIHSLTIEHEMVGLLMGDLCWDSPLHTLTKSMDTNEFWMLTFIFSEESHTYSLHNGTASHRINAHKSTLFYSSKMAIEIGWPLKKHSRFVSISFHRDWLRKKLAGTTALAANSPLMSLLQAESGIYLRGIPLFERMDAFDSLFKESSSLMWPLATEAQCYELIYDFMGQLVSIYQDNNDNAIANYDRKNVMDVENRYFLATQPLPDLEFLAGEAWMSLSKFKKCFKLIYGAAPYDYHLKLRLDIAADLLLQDKWTMGEIATQLGYATVAGFDKIFKKKFKMSPTEYLKQRQG